MGLENVLQKTALLLSQSDVPVQQAGFCSDLLPRDGTVLHLPQQGCPMVKQVQENQDVCVPEAPYLGAEQSNSDKGKNNSNVYLCFLSISVIQH